MLASNRQIHGEANDFPFIDELQNRVITTMDPNFECPPEGVGKQMVIDLTGPSSLRAGASQGGCPYVVIQIWSLISLEIPTDLDQFDSIASSVGCDDCDANSSDIVVRADACEVALQSVENGSERRASFDTISPLLTLAAGLVDSDAGDFVEDEANESVEEDVHALVAEGQKHAPPRGDFVECHSI